MGEVFKNKQIKSPFGIFFQVPVFAVASLGIFKLVEIFLLSFTEYNIIEKPLFVGFENYLNILKNEVVRQSFSNTVVMVLVVTLLLIFTAVLPALFTARLKLPFGLGVMAAFWLISLCTKFHNLLNVLFEDSIYGIINSCLINYSIINEPISFSQTFVKITAIIIMWLYCLAPVFSITYIAAKMKHGFLGTAVSVSLIPVLMYSGGGVLLGFSGYPSINYSADWFYSIFQDYVNVRFEVGFAYAILILGFIMLICWCVTVCSVSLGFWAIFKNVKSNPLAFKAIGYITFALSVILSAPILYFITAYFARAFMPLDELYDVPIPFLPEKPTLQNFSDLSELLSNTFGRYLLFLVNSLMAIPFNILPVCFFVALPSGVGLGIFKTFKHQKLLLLCFIPILLIADYTTFNLLDMTNTYSVYMIEFLSSFEFLITVFLICLAVKLVFYNRKPRVSGIFLGIFFILTSFYSMGVLRGLWYGSDSINSEQLKTWVMVSASLSTGGIARCGMTAANDLLTLLATIAVLIVPSILLITLYVLYRKNTKNLPK